MNEKKRAGSSLPQNDNLDILYRSNLAEKYFDSGLNLLPIRTDGSKSPPILYHDYIHVKRCPWYLLRKWIGGNGCGIGIICGKFSGNLEVLDFDDPAVFPLWVAKIDSQLLAKFPLVETPSGGRHIYYRCETVEGNKVLAYTELKTVRIETRGQGGYVVAPGSPLKTHPSGLPYRLIQGSLLSIPTITPSEREALFDAARGFNESRGNPTRSRGNLSRSKRSLNCLEAAQLQRNQTAIKGGQERPGDKFNLSATWEEILEPLGWTVAGTRSGVTYWQKPDGNGRGHQATTGCGSGDYFRCFSTACHPIETDKPYDKFGLWTLLYHDGNFSKAAKSLREVQ